VLSATVTPPESVVRKQLPDVVAAAAVPVFVGGPASLHYRDAFAAAGAQVLGTDIVAGIERIQDVLADVQAA
jgi:hypothetical protein